MNAVLSIIGSGAYPWAQRHRVSAEALDPFLDTVLAEVAAAGLGAWEPFLPSPDRLRPMLDTLRRHGLRMVSAYVNARLHDSDTSAEIDRIVAGCAAAREHDLEVLVCNPVPLDWNQPLDKDDATLRRQAAALQSLGEKLRAIGVRLAYHMHTPELRQAARELHHMMLATDPDAVGLCLDAHWIYRGAGHSHVALEDIVKLHGARTVSLHLRQSRNHIWHDTLEEGDIDHPWLAARLREFGFTGPAILEMAIEAGTPDRLDWVERHRRARLYVEQVFAPVSTSTRSRNQTS